MANCHQLFQDFNESIALDSGHKKILRRSRDAVRKKIKKYFKEKSNGLVPKFHGQGSFMMNTIIEPLDGEYDIDDGIYFQVEERPSVTVHTFHRWICEAVDGHTKEKPVDKQTCVRLIYANNYHLDLPVYYIIEGSSPCLAHKGEGWIASDPREFILWFDQKADSEGQLKRIVRYLKSWSDYRKRELPSGLIFSILAANNIAHDERDDVAFYQTLCNIRNSLDLSFVCYRPTTPAHENLLEDYSKTNKTYFMEQLSNFVDSAEDALDDDTNQEDASKFWRHHFGKDRFPLGVSEQTASTSFSESIFTRDYVESDVNFGSFDNTEEFIENQYPIHIQYHLRINCRVSQNGFRTRLLHELIARDFPLYTQKKLQFYISSCSVPKPYIVKWKIRNVGSEAIRRNCIRGKIVEDTGRERKEETSDFHGSHYVECYVIKNSICVARARIDVPIKNDVSVDS